MKDFKLVGGVEIENLGEYLRNYYKKNPKVKFYVGTDSVQNGKFTKYVTTVCMRHPEYVDNGRVHYGAGVHLVFKRNNVNRIREVASRLWRETELTLEVALYVDDALKSVWKQPLNNERVPIIHLDFNDSPKFKSHQVTDASVGWLTGEGFEVYTKPIAWAASTASDWLCK
jgi:predicted RNase H-related nuclease YkuK (DUF458 family)